MKGKLIIFEGGEGSGKTSQIKILANKLRKLGKKVIVTHEPGGTIIANKIRQVILHEKKESLTNKAELFLFLASRAQHVEKLLIPALKKGYIILCDRFTGSTLAYQIGARKLPNEKLIINMDRYAKNDLPEDITIYIDVDPYLGIKRKKDTLNKLTRIDQEKIKFHQQVRKYFQKLARQKNWVTINGNLTLKKNAQEIYEIISKKIK
jgi:dTMP kinase